MIGDRKRVLIEGVWDAKGFGPVSLPGSFTAQGYGDKVTADTEFVQSLSDPLWQVREEYKYGQEDGVQFPFFCQPEYTYHGEVCYSRTCYLLEGNYHLCLGMVKWKSTLYIDDIEMGSEDLLCSPHDYYFRVNVSGEHTITIAIDNSMIHPYRPDGHEVSDGLAATWNGIGEKLVLERLGNIWIEHIQVFPDIHGEKINVKLALGGDKNLLGDIKVKCNNEEITLVGYQDNFDFAIDNPKKWDEFEQHIYTITVSLMDKESVENVVDSMTTTFGFRDIKSKDGVLFVNDRPTFVRATHFGGDYPITGIADCSESFWIKMMTKIKEYGLNGIRMHSYCPPEIAFDVADRMGIYLEIECGMWNVFYKDSDMVKLLDRETEGILNHFGNHPSFLMFSPSNEPAGDWEHALLYWPNKWREYDNRHFYTMQSGWPFSVPPKDIPDEAGDFIYFHRSGFGIEPGGTIRNAPGHNGKDYRKSLEGIKKPVMSHELGQWCSYPDFSIIKKFTGFMKPSSYRIFKASAAAHNVLDYNNDFVHASGRLQVLMYKEDIEATLRTPSIYGFELLDIHDYLGQGSALVGFLDAFWDEKGYVNCHDFKHFCSSTVPLLRITKRVFTSNEQAVFNAEVCHFGMEPLKDVKISYILKDERGIISSYDKHVDEIPLGKNFIIPDFEFTCPQVDDSMIYTLRIELSANGFKTNNSWDIFVCNEPKAKPNVFTTTNPVEAYRHLKAGESVVLYAKSESLNLYNVPLKYRPVFWNAQMGPRAKKNLGAYINNRHSALKKFYSRYYVEHFWESIIDTGMGIDVEKLEDKIINVIRPVDDWNRNKNLSMMFETMVGPGHLMVAAFDKEAGLANKALAYSLESYMAAPKDISVAISEEEYKNIFFDRNITKKSHIECIDAAMPNANYEIKLEMPIKVDGLYYVPNQESRNHDEEIKTVTVTVGRVKKTFELKSSFEPKPLRLDEPVVTDSITVTVDSIYEPAGKKMWNETKNGWKQSIIEPIVELSRVPEFYIISNQDFDSDEMMLRFEAYKDNETTAVEDNKPFVKRDLED